LETVKSIFRYYKCNAENFEVLMTPYIFLYSARKWEADGEFDFKVVIESNEAFKQFLYKRLEEGFRLKKDDDGYFTFRVRCAYVLNKYGLIHLLGEKEEFDILLQKLYEEGTSEEGIKERKQLIKDNFFKKTGICCFTSDVTTLEDLLHWNRFTSSGSGYCVEYDFAILKRHFAENNAHVDGRYIKYYEKNLPDLTAPTKDFNETVRNFYEVFYSLKQSLKDEKEFRLAKAYREEVNDNDGKRKEIIPKESIISITLGPNISVENEEILKTMISKELPTATLFKVMEQFDTYFRTKLN
jgi:hypothetical protein